MRTFAFGLLVLCEILIALLWRFTLDSGVLSLVSTLIVVVLVSFLFSAIFSQIKSLKLSKNYGISGTLGVISGIFFYLWAKDNFTHLVTWLESFGHYILLLTILLCAGLLFFYKGAKEVPEQPQSINPD